MCIYTYIEATGSWIFRKLCIQSVFPSKKVALDGTGTSYECPIVKLSYDNEAEDETPAITIYLKRDTNVEAEKDTLARKTAISADKHYTVSLTDDSKVVLAKIKK